MYSALVCLTLCGSLAAKGRKSKLWLYFLLMCVSNAGLSLGDITSWTCVGFAQPWYFAARWACGAQVVQGANGALDPNGGATRAQVAAMLHRFAMSLI